MSPGSGFCFPNNVVNLEKQKGASQLTFERLNADIKASKQLSGVFDISRVRFLDLALHMSLLAHAGVQTYNRWLWQRDFFDTKSSPKEYAERASTLG